MIFTGRNSSFDVEERISSSSCVAMYRRTKKKPIDGDVLRQKSAGSGNESMGLQIENTISHQSSHVLDFDKQHGIERCLDDHDDDECTWLSSDSSSFFEEHRLSCLYPDDWLISWLSTLSNSYLHFAPHQETTISHDADLNGKGTATQLPNFPGSEDTVIECSPSSENLLRNNNGFSSQISDTERTSFSTSLINLGGEDSEWISDTESELDHFQSGFLSPSSRSICGFAVRSPNSSSDSVPAKVTDEKSHNTNLYSEPADLEDFSGNEPLFWPFEREHNWSSEEAWKCFSMSPRKSMIKVAANPALGLQFNGEKMDTEDTRRRRHLFKSGMGSTASKILELKQRNSNNGVKKINITLPSRLKKSNKDSMKIVPLDMQDDIIESADGKVQTPPSFFMDRDFFKDDLALNNELSIETVLGLGEFDGHEGVDSDNNEDVFSMEVSL